MNRFTHFWHFRILRDVLVKNVSPSPKYNGNLIEDWENYKKHEATCCARCGNSAHEDLVGGHVWLEPHSLPFDYYVVPLCSKCNNHTISEPYYVKRGMLAKLSDIVSHKRQATTHKNNQ